MTERFPVPSRGNLMPGFPKRNLSNAIMPGFHRMRKIDAGAEEEEEEEATFTYLEGWDTDNIYEISIDSSLIDSALTHFPIPITLGLLPDQRSILAESTVPSNVSLLIHSNNSANKKTEFIDSSNTGHTITAGGGVEHSTNDKYFGDTSIVFNGTTDYLSLPDHSCYDFGTGDFTIACFVRTDNDSGDGNSRRIISLGATATNVIQFLICDTAQGGGAGTLSFYRNDFAINTSTVITDDVWHHVALVRYSGRTDLYIDGTSEGNISSDTTSYIASSTWYIGRMVGAAGYFDGYMDEIVITKEALYTDDFTPPTTPYYATVATTDHFLALDFFNETSFKVTETNVCDESYTIGQENPTYYGGGFDGAIGGDANSCWYAYVAGYATSGWTGQDFGAGNEQTICTYRLYPYTHTALYNPRNWTFEGSHTGVWGGEEVVLDTVTGFSFANSSGYIDFQIKNPQSFRYYRIDVTLNNGDATYCVIVEMEMYAGVPADLKMAFADFDGNQLYAEREKLKTHTDPDIEYVFGGGNDHPGFNVNSVPTDNTTYRTFDGTDDSFYKSVDLGDNSTEVMMAKIRIHDKAKAACQVIWKDGGETNGVALGMDTSGGLGIFGRSGGALTSIKILSTEFDNNVWYYLVTTHSSVDLYDCDTGALVSSSAGTITVANGSGYESIGDAYNGSAISGDGGVSHRDFFDGDIEFIRIYTSNDYEPFPSATFHVSSSDLEISNSEDTKLYLYYDDTQDDNHEYIGEASDLNAYTAKSVILDIADNWGSSSFIDLRSVEFYYRGVLLPVVAADMTCYSTTNFSADFVPVNAFDTSLSKIGTNQYVSWATTSSTVADQRLICVFDDEITFDQIVINNQHDSGDTNIDTGVKNVVIYVSRDTITSTTYEEAIASSTVIFNGQFPEHRAYDVIDDYVVPITGLKPLPALEFTAKSVILDFADNWGGAAMGIRSIDFYYRGTLISLASEDITCYSTTFFTGYPAEKAFITSLNKAGAALTTSWSADTAQNVNQRLTCVFDSSITFDEIVINNYHSSGATNIGGVKNVVIQVSSDSITSTTYNESIANSTGVFDGVFPAHILSDVADDITLILRRNNDALVSLLIHSDTIDGSTAFTDSSLSQHTITANGDVHHETDESYFGDSSIYFDGTTDYLSVPADTNFSFGSEDYTISFRAYFTALSTTTVLYSYGGGVGSWSVTDGHEWLLWADADDFYFQTNNSGSVDSHTFAHSLEINTWYHIEVNRSGTSLKIYVNGVSAHSGTATDVTTVTTPTPLTIGCQNNLAGYFSGYMDEIIFINGEALHTDEFTPPESPYSLNNVLPHQRVWDENYVAVYNMAQDPSGGTGCVKDSTTRKLDGTPGGTMTSADLVESNNGYAIDLDGTDDYVNFGVKSVFDHVAEQTYELSFKMNRLLTAAGGYLCFLSKGGIYYSNGWSWQIYEANEQMELQLYSDGTLVDSVNWVSGMDYTDREYLLTVQWGSGLNTKMYLDDELIAEDVTPPTSLSSLVTHSLQLGQNSHASIVNLDAIVGSLRVSNTVRDASWIKAAKHARLNNLVTITKKAEDD